MVATATSLAPRRGDRLCAGLASSEDEVREAQALRYRVFGQELGARLKTRAKRLDIDRFDAHCEHLLVRDSRTGQVVGCTRLLSDEKAARLGCFYSETEFDLAPLARLPGRRLEVGRTCIAPAFRQGPAIAVLWSGLAGYIQNHGFDYLFGCVSMPLGEGDLLAAAIMNRLRRQAMAPAACQVIHRVPLLASRADAAVLDAPLPSQTVAIARLAGRNGGDSVHHVETGRNGVKAPPCDPGAFIAAGLELARDRPRLQRLGIQARQSAMRSNWDRVIQDFEQGLARIIQSRRERLSQWPAVATASRFMPSSTSVHTSETLGIENDDKATSRVD